MILNIRNINTCALMTNNNSAKNLRILRRKKRKKKRKRKRKRRFKPKYKRMKKNYWIIWYTIALTASTIGVTASNDKWKIVRELSFHYSQLLRHWSAEFAIELLLLSIFKNVERKTRGYLCKILTSYKKAIT